MVRVQLRARLIAVKVQLDVWLSCGQSSVICCGYVVIWLCCGYMVVIRLYDVVMWLYGYVMVIWWLCGYMVVMWFYVVVIRL